jgi:hypothetical protein
MIEEKKGERHRKGNEKFKQAIELKQVDAYCEPEENSCLIPPPENYQPPICICSS